MDSDCEICHTRDYVTLHKSKTVSTSSIDRWRRESLFGLIGLIRLRCQIHRLLLSARMDEFTLKLACFPASWYHIYWGSTSVFDYLKHFALNGVDGISKFCLFLNEQASRETT